MCSEKEETEIRKRVRFYDAFDLGDGQKRVPAAQTRQHHLPKHINCDWFCERNEISHTATRPNDGWLKKLLSRGNRGSDGLLNITNPQLRDWETLLCSFTVSSLKQIHVTLGSMQTFARCYMFSAIVRTLWSPNFQLKRMSFVFSFRRGIIIVYSADTSLLNYTEIDSLTAERTVCAIGRRSNCELTYLKETTAIQLVSSKVEHSQTQIS